MLQHPISNAAKNAERVPEGRIHLEIIKKFATSLFIYIGPLAYHFTAERHNGITVFKKCSRFILQQNVTLALPSLRSVRGYIYSEYNIINEGVFRF